MHSVALRDRDLSVLRAIFRRFPVVQSVRVFGSRATGEARRASDLDLAISAPTASPCEWADLCEALENAPLIYELDVVRCERTSHTRIGTRVAREGVTIYPE